MPTRRLRSLLLLLALASFLAAPAAAEARGWPTWQVERPAKPKPTAGDRAAKIALTAVGVPYQWAGASPSTGFDCSGLVYWAYGRLGVSVPHSSYALYETGRPVSLARLRAGDVLFFSGLGHVGIYIGRGRMVHAPQSGRTVEVVHLRGSHYGSRLVGARRIAT